VFWNVLQCFGMCCSVLECVAVFWNVLQCFGMCCSVLECVAVCCNVLQCDAMCYNCSVLQCVAVCCRVLQCVTSTSKRHFRVTWLLSMKSHATYTSHTHTFEGQKWVTWLFTHALAGKKGVTWLILDKGNMRVTHKMSMGDSCMSHEKKMSPKWVTLLLSFFQIREWRVTEYESLVKWV